ncbi:uncharacterized protein MYCGRDRAFT_102983 [Zymoseptoria tritici IPO323]|uniref:Uncharacterized protein n=1 Tax=Zymoseptoria tritici (strain CBS 115943 / IPO323) TaxID=336722 RepID=F9WXA3_ZYMTI|nr:uncharacterized protein MYCGRDRAFT_102983 [Zymoseptoria tritici IPO323]EGP91790.1 hypothetical protein MYCGRDRAFT_102983 [Zymoseptoria tritici IPO323]
MQLSIILALPLLFSGALARPTTFNDAPSAVVNEQVIALELPTFEGGLSARPTLY